MSSLLVAMALASGALPFDDPVVNKLAGHWTVTGTVRGKAIEQKLDADWVLDHHWLELHFAGAGYEARVFLGWDEPHKQLVMHWLDVTGAGPSYSEPAGHGARSGSDAFIITFEYPDGPFRDTFRWNGSGWTLLIEGRDKSGKWFTFADERLVRR